MLNDSYNESYNIVRLDNLQTLVLERGSEHKDAVCLTNTSANNFYYCINNKMASD